MNLFRRKVQTNKLSDNVVIRHLKQIDLPALEWGGEFTHFRKLYQETYNSSRRGRAVLWVAEIPGNGLIGQMFVQLNSSRHELADGLFKAYIFGFRIQPNYRGQGIGTRMMETVENDLRKRGYNSVTLNVAQDNLEARRLYERRGYKVVAEEPGQWSYIDHEGRLRDVDEPSWRMEKKL